MTMSGNWTWWRHSKMVKLNIQSKRMLWTQSLWKRKPIEWKANVLCPQDSWRLTRRVHDCSTVTNHIRTDLLQLFCSFHGKHTVLGTRFFVVLLHYRFDDLQMIKWYLAIYTFRKFQNSRNKSIRSSITRVEKNVNRWISFGRETISRNKQMSHCTCKFDAHFCYTGPVSQFNISTRSCWWFSYFSKPVFLAMLWCRQWDIVWQGKAI